MSLPSLNFKTCRLAYRVGGHVADGILFVLVPFSVAVTV